MRDTNSRKPAPAGFSVPIAHESDPSDEMARRFPTDIIVRMKRPDGREYFLRVGNEHLDRLIEIARKEFVGVVKKGAMPPELFRGRVRK